MNITLIFQVFYQTLILFTTKIKSTLLIIQGTFFADGERKDLPMQFD